jgi:hypothetical protein
MNSLVISLLASTFAALSSLLFRKNCDHLDNQSPSGYLLLFYSLCFTSAIAFNFDIWTSKVNWTIVALGALVGSLSSLLMLVTSRALQHGSSAITYAFQNASAVFPGLILFVVLRKEFGYSCSNTQIIGITFVLFGLFLGVKNESGSKRNPSSKWLTYVLCMFVLQASALTLIQGRCLLFNTDFGLFPETDDVWFMPGQFFSAFIIQLMLFLKEKRGLRLVETLYGSLGGIANYTSTALLLFATKCALPHEQSILFPCFAVSVIILCNFWSNRFYKEPFNYKTNALCSFGIFLAVA